MSTVLSKFGLRITIYSNDHRPAHVHVIGRGFEAVFRLNCFDGPPELRENYGFSRKDLAKIAEELAACLAVLCNEWRRVHGNF